MVEYRRIDIGRREHGAVRIYGRPPPPVEHRTRDAQPFVPRGLFIRDQVSSSVCPFDGVIHRETLQRERYRRDDIREIKDMEQKIHAADAEEKRTPISRDAVRRNKSNAADDDGDPGNTCAPAYEERSRSNRFCYEGDGEDEVCEEGREINAQMHDDMAVPFAGEFIREEHESKEAEKDAAPRKRSAPRVEHGEAGEKRAE